MTKTEYLSALRSALTGMTSEERESAVKYYEEFFEEAGEENEQDVIADLGSPQKLAQSILSDQDGAVYSERSAENPPQTVKTAPPPAASNNNNNIAKIIVIVALVVTSPVWGSALASIFGILVGLVAAVAGMILGGFASIIWGIMNIIAGNIALGGAFSGGGLIVFAIGMLLLAPTVLLFGKGIPALCRGIGSLWRKMFGEKAAAQRRASAGVRCDFALKFYFAARKLNNYKNRADVPNIRTSALFKFYNIIRRTINNVAQLLDGQKRNVLVLFKAVQGLVVYA